jgi:hypothetical protein
VYISKVHNSNLYYTSKVTKKLAYGPREDFKQIIIGFSVYLKCNVYLGLEPGSIRSIFKYNCNKYKIMEYPMDLSNNKSELKPSTDLRKKYIEMYKLSGCTPYTI